MSRLVLTWRDWLVEQLHEWLPAGSDADTAERVLPAVGRIARRAMLEHQREVSRVPAG